MNLGDKTIWQGKNSSRSKTRPGISAGKEGVEEVEVKICLS